MLDTLWSQECPGKFLEEGAARPCLVQLVLFMLCLLSTFIAPKFGQHQSRSLDQCRPLQLVDALLEVFERLALLHSDLALQHGLAHVDLTHNIMHHDARSPHLPRLPVGPCTLQRMRAIVCTAHRRVQVNDRHAGAG